jgi:hypothetical protein
LENEAPNHGAVVMLPPFQIDGNLPVAVHVVSLAEVQQRFGSGNATRQALFVRLERIFRLAAATGHLGRFIVFGSFITAKEFPNDVDVFMLMNDEFDAARLAGESKILFDHSNAEAYYGCSVFWIRKLAAFGGEQAAVEDWQVCRGGGLRGIVEVVE